MDKTNYTTQDANELCWAAVTAMVHNHFEPTATLSCCAVANGVLDQTSCCVDPTTSFCNQPYELDQALAECDHFESFRASDAPKSAELDAAYSDPERPIALNVRNADAGGAWHSVVIAMWDAASSTTVVSDPDDNRRSHNQPLSDLAAVRSPGSTEIQVFFTKAK